MKHHTLFATLFLATLTTAAHAQPKPLSVKVYTSSPGGFLVDSTLVMGDKEAILVDAQFTLSDAHRLVAEILESRKNLTTVYVTHAHPDHYFGLEVVRAAFPKVKIVALPATVAAIKQTAQAKVKEWSPMYGGNLTTHPIVPSPLAGSSLTLDGQTLEIHGAQGDDAVNSYVWIPSIKTVIAGDTIYRGVHVWTAETTPDTRKAWEKTLDQLAALQPAVVIAGHKDPKLDDGPAGIEQTRQYLRAFDVAVASSKSAGELEQKMKTRFKDLQLDVIAHIGAGAALR